MNVIHSKRVQSVLNKGIDMTTNDIKYLLKREISKAEIAQALEMSGFEFEQLIATITGEKLLKERKQLYITVDEYIKYRQSGMQVGQIAALKGVGVTALHRWKSRNSIRDIDLVQKGLLSKDRLYGRQFVK